MHRDFLSFLERCAVGASYKLQQTCATFNISRQPSAKGVLPGAVYGLAVVLSEMDAQALEVEAREKGSLKTSLSKIKMLPLGNSLAIPLYWGKDEAIGFRVYRHLLDKKPKAGCLSGRFYAALVEKDLLVASVPVCDSTAFEKHMETSYPPLLSNTKTSNIHHYKSGVARA